MSFATIFREAMVALGRNRVRSALTMLGIIMGVAAFICVVAVGNAGSSQVQEQLNNVGDNMIWVEAGSRARSGVRIGSRGIKTLTIGDEKAVVEQIPGIKSGTPNVASNLPVIYKNQNSGTHSPGVSPA